ncbi:ATP phosphoribosyltransferase regulatory subunit [Saccharospirillum mangrovi]|uniref:ATP phosphoribosyltransferase regulatory subunit n=1 Tax=Saccharospirillum mangrovi TaxID=2161747 RepID=UPI000D39FABF|nr:ATP phosphoribosyltransferase regulatory subunit [Saccharospirillum mangrovi]
MTIAERWLLPDGIEEILPPEAARIEALRRLLLDEYRAWGYDLVIPPNAEYLESLLTGVGHDLDLLTYKLTDQATGRLMGLSADKTQQVARMDAHSMPRQGVSRYCYSSDILHARSTHLLSSRSPIQIGAELYGYYGSESDVEIVSLMLASLTKAGLADVSLDLGHIGIYRALVESAGLSADAQAELFELLRRRALPDLRAWLARVELNDQYKGWLAALPECHGSIDTLADWRRVFAGAPDTVFEALDTLEGIARLLSERFADLRIHLDLAELRDYNYHTGLVFSAFVPGFGQPVAKGGRYDATGKVFGRSRPATGFSSDLKILASQTTGQWHEAAAILAPAAGPAGLDAAIMELRAQGERVIQLFSDQTNLDELNCNRELVQQGDRWTVQPLTKQQAN